MLEVVPSIVAPAAGLSTNGSSLIWSFKAAEDDQTLQQQTLNTDEIVFILPDSEDSSSHLIYAVEEDATNEAQPYRLSILRVPHVPRHLRETYLLNSLPHHLQSTSSHQVHVIVSTKSGIGRALPCWENIVQPLLSSVVPRGTTTAASADASANRVTNNNLSGATPDGAGVATDPLTGYDVLITESAQSVRHFARERWGALQEMNGEGDAKMKRTETIILLSGDGGIVDLLNGSDPSANFSPTTTTSPTRPTLAVLPLGTGNALFHSLHKPLYSSGDAGPTPLVLGLRTLFHGVSAPLPLFRASFSPRSRIVTYVDPNRGPDSDPGDLQRRESEVDHLLGGIVASYGFHASIVWESDTPEYRKHGEARFGMVARELLQQSHGYRAKVEIRRPAIDGADGGRGKWEILPREEFGYVLSTLVSNLERKFTISPDSRPLGGKLRLVHFGAVGGEKTMEIMMGAYNEGAHVNMKWKVAKSGEQEAGNDEEEDKVGYDEVDGLKVTVHEEDPRWRKVCIDGTIVELEQNGWMMVERNGGPVLDILVDRSILS